MENFEALQNIDNFCKVLVKKTTAINSETGSPNETGSWTRAIRERENLKSSIEARSNTSFKMPQEFEDPFVDVFDEGDHIRILVQCRCQEQQVTFHPSKDGLVICREECHKEKDGAEMCRDICRKLHIRMDGLQLENMLFLVAKCNNNNTLEAMIPKIKQ